MLLCRTRTCEYRRVFSSAGTQRSLRTGVVNKPNTAEQYSRFSNYQGAGQTSMCALLYSRVMSNVLQNRRTSFNVRHVSLKMYDLAIRFWHLNFKKNGKKHSHELTDILAWNSPSEVATFVWFFSTKSLSVTQKRENSGNTLNKPFFLWVPANCTIWRVRLLCACAAIVPGRQHCKNNIQNSSPKRYNNPSGAVSSYYPLWSI